MGRGGDFLGSKRGTRDIRGKYRINKGKGNNCWGLKCNSHSILIVLLPFIYIYIYIYTYIWEDGEREHRRGYFYMYIASCTGLDRKMPPDFCCNISIRTGFLLTL